AAGHVDIIVGVQTVRARANIQIAARNLDGEQVAALADIAVCRVDAVVRGGYVKITAAHGHCCALQSLGAVRDHDSGYRRVVPLRADGQRVVRVDRVVRCGEGEVAARYGHIGRVDRVVRAVNGECAAG